MEKQLCLNFLGIGAAFLPQLKNTSAWFIKDDIFYLLDCGESVFEQLSRNQEFLQSKEVIVLVTHTHCDHCGSLGTLVSYCNFVLNKKISIFSPTNRIKRFLSLVGINEKYYTFIDDVKKINNVCINYFPVKHADDIKCFGYHLLVNSKKIYYSGDAKIIPEKVVTSFINGDIDYIFQDTSLIKNDHHCFIEDIKSVIPKEKRHNFYCMHLDSLKVDNIINSGFQIPTVNLS